MKLKKTISLFLAGVFMLGSVNAVLAEEPETNYCTTVCPRDAVIRKLSPCEIKKEADGVIYDCGQNISGYPVIEIHAKAGEEVTLGNYLDHAALFTNMDQTERAQAVKLMTIHAAKGLEFPVVFICGMSEGIFPGKRANTREKLEEERRLCYVAFTRAKDRLFLSDAAGTNYDGSFRYPSRFLFNAEKENIDYAIALDPDLEERALEQIRKTENLDPQPEQPSEIVGKRVLHPVFGEGTVIGIPRGQAGMIIQFDAMITPRTFGASAKIIILS